MAENLSPEPRERLLVNLNRRRIPGLDGIRGIAALAVVGFHDQLVSHSDFFGRFYSGRLAVQVFFVISGLLITWLLIKEHERDGSVNRVAFYCRRAFRLLPALLALLLWQSITQLPHASKGGMAAAALYYANYYGIIHGSAGLDGLGQTWSLAVEEHFYLIWPLVFVMVRNRRRLFNGCLIVMALQIVWRLAAGYRGHFVYAELATETASCAALAGCALALLLRYHPERLPRWVLNPYLGGLSAAVLIGLNLLPRNAQLWWGVPLGIPFAVVVVLQAITFEWKLLENPVARYLGTISYGIYVWGMVAIALGGPIIEDWHHLPVFAIVIGLASASFFLIERPIQSMGRKWLAKKPSAAEVPAY